LPAELADVLNLFFPYRWLFVNVISNRAEFSELLRIVPVSSPGKYHDSLLAVFRLLKGLTPDEHIVLAVAEALLQFFIKESARVDFLKDFEFSQRSIALLRASFADGGELDPTASFIPP
jgi:hypothetical protein